MHYMRSMAYMQWQTHPAGAVRLDFQFNNDMTHQTTRWHDYTMPCLTRRWHASLTYVHDAMPLADHNGMHHWHTMAWMTAMNAGVLPSAKVLSRKIRERYYREAWEYRQNTYMVEAGFALDFKWQRRGRFIGKKLSGRRHPPCTTGALPISCRALAS